MKFARGSYLWILTPILILIITLFLTILFQIYNPISLFITIIIFLITILLIIFFRDPNRKIGNGIVSPADGFIREIYKLKDDDIGDCKVISIFMNIHNVHVNRMPIDGKIIDIIHISGSHIPAFKKESDRNERVITNIYTSIGFVKIIQIAGTLARRIVPYIKKNDTIKKGEKIGLIRLGSRVDLYLPDNKNIKYLVKKGDKIKAGESIVAEINV